jgi:hypothetical protein
VLKGLAVVSVLNASAAPLETSRGVGVLLRRVVKTKALEERRGSDLDGELVGGAGEVKETETVVVGLIDGRADNAVDGALDVTAGDEGENLSGLSGERWSTW